MRAAKIFCLYLFLFVSCSEVKKPEKENPVIPDSLPVNQNQFAVPDQSPMDMSYFPSSYPLMKMDGKTNDQPIARVIYSRPHKKGRKIFGDSPQSLCRYGAEWRLGANEATEIEFFRDVKVADKIVTRGRYIMYCVPYPDRWTVALNTNLYTWGLHMDSTKDLLRTNVPVQKLAPSLEDFTIVFLPSDAGTDLLMAWDDVKVILPISFIR